MVKLFKLWTLGKYSKDSFFTEKIGIQKKALGGAGLVIQVDEWSEDGAPPYPREFAGLVDRALEMLSATPTGYALLRELCAPSEHVVIVSADLGTGDGRGNAARVIADEAMNLVAFETLKHRNGARNGTRRALIAAAGGGDDLARAADWLAARICSGPVLSWPEDRPLDRLLPITEAVPGIAARKDELAADLLGCIRGDAKLQGIALYQKYKTTKLVGLNPAVKMTLFEHIAHTTIALLSPYADRSAGTGAAIRWNIDPDFAPNAERPPAIALAHELIHAYFAVRGDEPGRDINHHSTVLFEFRCVGLGPWAAATPSENAIRSEWDRVREVFEARWMIRTSKDAAYRHPINRQNHKAPHARRPRYGGVDDVEVRPPPSAAASASSSSAAASGASALLSAPSPSSSVPASLSDRARLLSSAIGGVQPASTLVPKLRIRSECEDADALLAFQLYLEELHKLKESRSWSSPSSLASSSKATPAEAAPDYRAIWARTFRFIDVVGDGNCLFRALSVVLYGHENMHGSLRSWGTTYMGDHPEIFDVALGFDDVYYRAMRVPATGAQQVAHWGGAPEILAVARVMGRRVFVHNERIRNGEYVIGDDGGGPAPRGSPDLHIYFHGGNHYQAMRSL